MHWLYLSFPSLIIDMHPCRQIRQGKCIVYKKNKNRISQLSQSAIEAGITMQMGLAQALSIEQHLVVIPDSETMQNQYLIRIAQSLYQIASDIVIDAPSGLAVRLDNLITYYGDLPSLWMALKGQITSLHVRYDYADGFNIQVAKLLCTRQLNRFICNKEVMLTELYKCPLAHTDLSTQEIHALLSIGVSNLGQLLKLPIKELGRRFKNDTIRYIQTLNEKQAPGYSTFAPPMHFKQCIEPDYELEKTSECRIYLHDLIDQLGVFLRYRNLQAVHLYCCFSYRDSDSSCHKISAAAPTCSAIIWKELTDIWLDALTLDAPVTEITLLCDEFENLSFEHQDFFIDRYSDRASLHLLGRLKAKLGEQSVNQVIHCNDHRVEQVIHTVQDTATSPQSVSDFQCPLLLVSPVPLTTQGKVTYGPVRLETGWWDDTVIKRDYFIVENENGQYLLTFKDYTDGWFVQGLYV